MSNLSFLGNELFFYKKKEEKRWCVTHPNSFWGRNGMGGWWPKCVKGNKTGEKCKIGK